MGVPTMESRRVSIGVTHLFCIRIMLGVVQTYTGVKIHRTVHREGERVHLLHYLKNEINTHTYVYVYMHACMYIPFLYT